MTDRETKETARAEAFSDGVFAIAITLLILDIKVPHEAGSVRALMDALGAQWHAYVAYAMSFWVILVMWINHHRIFSMLRTTDHRFLFWNGLLLMCVSIVPFPTSLVAEYFDTPAARMAAAVYSGHGLLIALAFQGVWQYARRNPQLFVRGVQRDVERLNARYRFGPVMYLVAFLLAFVSASASMGLCLVMAVFFSFMGFTDKDG
jgi:TMEM175 potassium channel family protein